MPFTQTIIDVASSSPDRLALSDGVRELTYAELLRDSPAHHSAVKHLTEGLTSADLAGLTLADGLTELPVVSLSLSTVLDTAAIVAMLAGYGVVTSVLDPLWPIAHRMRAIRRSGTCLVITDDPALLGVLTAESWPGAAVTLDAFRALTEEFAGRAEGPGEAPAPRADDEPFLLIFTSGTTDEPKGFVRTRRSWRYNASISAQYLFAQPGALTFAPGPLAYSLTLYALVEVLATGGSLMLQHRFSAIESHELMVRHGVERLVAVPAVLPALAQAAARAGHTFETLTSAVIGGATLSDAVRERFAGAAPRATLLSYYGAAEIGFIGYSLDGGSLLTPFAGLELEVRGPSGEVLQAGELGQLFVRVASQGDRYISTTGGARITGPDGWSTVDDHGRLLEGKLLLEGRAGDMAVTGGHNVSLVQVDRALEAVAGAEHSTSVTQPHPSLGEVIVAVIERPAHGADPEKAEVLAALSQLLPPQFVPRRIYLADDLPRTVGGKVRRGETRELLEQGAFDRL